MKPKEERRIIVMGPSRGFEATWDGREVKCRGKTCGDMIGFATTTNGKKIPITLPEIETKEGVDCYEPHWASCPDEDRFR
jgi:hypothetical protein